MSDTIKEELFQAINVVTVNHFSGIMTTAATSALPKGFDKAINTENYRTNFKSDPVLFWGENNRFPDDIEKEAMASSVLEGGMKVLCDHLRGQGFALALPTYKDGKRILEEVQDDEVMDELEAMGYYEYWYDACGELPKWGNVWPIFGMNDNRDINLIKLHDGSFNRFQRPQPTTGKVENIYVSGQWSRNIHTDLRGNTIPANLKPWVQLFPLLNRYNYVNEMDGMKNTKFFASHHKFHTSGFNYGRAPWHSLYLNRWLGISGKVPEMMMRYYEAAMTINYLIYINNEWLMKKYPEMEKWDAEQRTKKIKEIQAEYEKNLKGSGNAFKSLMLAFNYNAQGNEEKNVKFELLDNKMREGTFIPDSQVSDGQILFTLGIDPSLIGVVVPGGKQSAGSGSNIREASLALQMRLRPDRELNHLPFYIWRDYKFRNSTDKKKRNLQIVTRDYLINTLDGRAMTTATETTPQS